jgi:hypothetical protein
MDAGMRLRWSYVECEGEPFCFWEGRFPGDGYYLIEPPGGGYTLVYFHEDGSGNYEEPVYVGRDITSLERTKRMARRHLHELIKGH